MQLNPVESIRFSSIIQEGIDRLDVLSVMAPEVSQEDEIAAMVNDEISRIIEEQRSLQARYEELILQRTQLKNLSNKTRYKEIQTEIEQIATKLRFATKILCRNLKEDPNIAANIIKIQHERDDLKSLLGVLIADLKEGTFRTLMEILEKEKRKNEELKNSVAAVKQAGIDIKKIQEELQDQSEERKRDEASQSLVIDKLREDLQELRARTVLEGKYEKKEAKGNLDSTRRVFNQTEKGNDEQIGKLRRNLSVEAQKQEELQLQTEYWDQKHETDIEEMDRQLEEMKSKKAHAQNKLADLKARLIEAREYHKDVQKKRTIAAGLIQHTWRQYRKRKIAKEKLRKLKKAAVKPKKNGRSRSKSPKQKGTKANKSQTPKD
ncbi:hypothetical protein PROFUN_12492 [Planoprotostelium fungivorum]|uniref:Uncharacterized protein n=1 Tax=Planoprotostelium fungivorum TaxID=1890364 RepID=A0A2P6N7A2_9EUKA|nr:hypothetical protein PROFUN_12492 [Planoprotostelium fungivorum]